MDALLLPNGNLLVPTRVEEAALVGDGMLEVTPDMPVYQAWYAYYARRGKPIPLYGAQQTVPEEGEAPAPKEAPPTPLEEEGSGKKGADRPGGGIP